VYLATRYNATIGNDTETIILATKLKSFDEVYFKSSAIIFLAFTYNKICEYSKSLNILEEAKVFDRDYIFFHPDLYIANLMKLGLYNKMVSTYFYDYHKLSVENRLCFIQSLYETETGSKAEIKELLTDLYENNLELLLEGDNLHFYRSLIVRFPNN
jgi:hypothetical protein